MDDNGALAKLWKPVDNMSRTKTEAEKGYKKVEQEL